MNLNISLFTSDDYAFMEPHNDIISTAFVVIGFVIFASVITAAYSTFDDNSCTLDNYRHASMMANDIANYKGIQGKRMDVISARELDIIAEPVQDPEKHAKFFQRFSGNIDFSVDIYTNDEIYHWTIEKHSDNPEQRDIVAASAPVVIELGNNARCVPGTLTVNVLKNECI